MINPEKFITPVILIWVKSAQKFGAYFYAYSNQFINKRQAIDITFKSIRLDKNLVEIQFYGVV